MTEKKDWVAKKLEDPEFRVGVEIERLIQERDDHRAKMEADHDELTSLRTTLEQLDEILPRYTNALNGEKCDLVERAEETVALLKELNPSSMLEWEETSPGTWDAAHTSWQIKVHRNDIDEVDEHYLWRGATLVGLFTQSSALPDAQLVAALLERG